MSGPGLGDCVLSCAYECKSINVYVGEIVLVRRRL